MSDAPKPNFISYNYTRLCPEEQYARAKAYFELMDGRRSIREFSDEPVPLELIEYAIRTAGTGPTGAHKQPYCFVVVQDPDLKRQIREAAEAEEYENYNKRMPDTWLEDLAPFGTDWHKPYIETVPYVIVVFKISYELVDGKPRNNYYVNESVGIAAGMLIAALHNMGLYTLPHTPSPMNFLQKLLDRPANEKPILLMPVGYPAQDVQVPDLQRKPLEQIMLLK